MGVPSWMASVGERPGRPFSGMVAGRSRIDQGCAVTGARLRPKSEAAPTPSRKRLRASSNSTMPFISCKERRTASARLRPRSESALTPSRKRLRASSKSTMPTISRKKRRTVKEDTSVCMAETVKLVGDAAEDVELHFLRHPQKDIQSMVEEMLPMCLCSSTKARTSAKELDSRKAPIHVGTLGLGLCLVCCRTRVTTCPRAPHRCQIA